MGWLRGVGLAIAALLLLGVAALFALGRGAFGGFDSETFVPAPPARAPSSVEAGAARQR